MAKLVYVISDLHLGGGGLAEIDQARDPSRRGFRMCTQGKTLGLFIDHLTTQEYPRDCEVELVINGDFVDFLAEKSECADPVTGNLVSGWHPFIEDPAEATKVLQRIIDSEKSVFDALKAFLAAGHRLTLMIGNHDLELSFPASRQLIEHELASAGKNFSFIYDGEAYNVGRLLIEHGNRYDGWNAVSHDGLRRVRSTQSRKEPLISGKRGFQPPPGSIMVATVMNKIKEQFPFVDLLKPEGSAAIPILLALEPNYRRHMLIVLKLYANATRHFVGSDGLPRNSGDIDAIHIENVKPQGQAMLDEIIANRLSSDEAYLFNSLTRGTEGTEVHTDLVALGEGDISSFDAHSSWGLLRLLTASSSGPIERRMPALLMALNSARKDYSFDLLQEDERYLSAARRLLANGFQAVVFGHTHLAKNIVLPGGKYINTGTWADLISLQETSCSESSCINKENLKLNLDSFVSDMSTERLGRHVLFRPTYARIKVEEDKSVSEALLLEFTRADALL